MKMKLYCNLTSPYARKVRVVAAELGLSDLIEEVHIDPYSTSEELLALNPLSRIPTLVTDKGEVLIDSALIIEYLFSRGRGLATLPHGSKRWSQLRRQHLADGITQAAVLTAQEKRRPESIVYTAWLDRQRDVIQRALDAIEAELEETPLELESPCTVEVAFGVALGYLDFRQPYFDWRAGHEKLAQWYAAFAERPSMLATQPVAA